MKLCQNGFPSRFCEHDSEEQLKSIVKQLNTRKTRNTKRNTFLIKLFSAIDQSHVPLLPVPELETFCSVEMFELEVRVKIV